VGATGTWIPSAYARTDCTTMSSEVGCQTSSPAQFNFNHNGGSDDYVFVDNGVTGALYQMTIVAP